MLNLFRKSAPVSSEVAYTLRLKLQIRGKELPQTQYVTEHYVATEVGDQQLLLFRADTSEAFVVRRADERLERLDLSQQAAQMQQLRAALGPVQVEPGDDEREINGFPCRRYSVRAESPVMVLSGDFWFTPLPDLRETALTKQREFDAKTQPFVLDLAPGDVVIRSDVKVLAQGTEQDQGSEVVSFEKGIEELEAFDRMLGWKVVG